MFTITLTVLTVLVIGGILLKLLDSIVVESYTISTRDLPNIADTAGSEPFPGDSQTRPGVHRGGAR